MQTLVVASLFTLCTDKLVRMDLFSMSQAFGVTFWELLMYGSEPYVAKALKI